MDAPYISPTLINSGAILLADFLHYVEEKPSSLPHGGQSLKLEDLLQERSVCVFGEPGYGKSRLLQELYGLVEKDGVPCVFIDLKQVGTTLITDYVGENIGAGPSYSKNEWSFKASTRFEVEQLATAHFFLDALDEVRLELIPEVLWNIKRLVGSSEQVRVYFSCRTHHAKRFLKEFEALNVTYCSIRPFSVLQVIDYLKACAPSLKDLSDNDIIEKLDPYFHRDNMFNRRSILDTPRYLEYFCELLKKHDFDYVIGLKRAAIFAHIIDSRLNEENDKNNELLPGYKQKIPYIKQCFERLALVMEIQRINIISKDDFASFDIDTQLNISGQIDLDIFYDRTLFKDNGDHLQFDNTEFQEYLAAKAVQRLGKAEQVVFDLAVDKKLKSVYTTWLNPLSFLVELEPVLLQPLIEFGIRSEDPSLFVLTSYSKAGEHTEEAELAIYERIIRYYVIHKRFFDERVVGGLGLFFNPEVHEKGLFALASQSSGLKAHFNATIAAEVLGSFLAQGGNSEDLSEDWSTLFLPLVDPEATHSRVLTNCILRVLPQICSLQNFEASGIANTYGSSYLFSGVIKFYREVAPNSIEAVRANLKSVERRNTISHESPFAAVNTKDGFRHLFAVLLDQETYRQINYETYRGYSVLSDTVMKNLGLIYDAELRDLLLASLNTIVGFRIHHNDEIRDSIIEFLQKREADLIPLLVDNMAHLDISDRNVVSIYGEIFTSLLTNQDEVDLLVSLLDGTEEKRAILLEALISVKRINIKEQIASLFPEVAARWKTNGIESVTENRKWEKKHDFRELQHLEKFNNLLKKSSTCACSSYPTLSEANKAKVTSVQLLKLKKIVVGLIQDFDPLSGTIRVKVVDEKTSNIRKDHDLIHFGDAVLLLDELDIDPTPFRSKILQSLLFYYKDEDKKVAHGLVPNPSSREVSVFARQYTMESDSDVKSETLGTFISLCKEIDGLAEAATPFLTEMITNHKMSSSYRVRALELLPHISQDPEQLTEIFHHYLQQDAGDDRTWILQAVNRLMLKLQSREAFEWRVDLVLEKTYDLPENNVMGTTMRSPAAEEDLGVPLQNITSEEFLEDVMVLLEKSFALLAEDDTKYNYVKNELWSFIVPYLIQTKLTIETRMNILERINQLLKKYAGDSKVHWFYSRRDKIGDAFLRERSRPITFGSATKIYLEVRRKQYLDIAYPAEVFSLIKETINIDLRKWVDQGAYRIFDKANALSGERNEREDLMQKTMVSQLKYFLIRKGFRDSDMKQIDPVIYREIQLPNDRRVDLVITYGAVGAVMVEIKRMGSGDLSPGKIVAYKPKFMAYLEQTNCSFGIYLVFLDREDKRKSFSAKLKELQKLYKEHFIEVIGIDCLGRVKEKS